MADENKQVLEALRKAQEGFTAVHRGRTGQVGSRQYKYADLHDVMTMVQPVLHENGLTVYHESYLEEIGGTYVLATVLAHSSGETLRTVLPLLGSDDQGIGASITYMRRYGLSCLLSIVTDDDTDGAPKPKRTAPAKEGPKSDGPGMGGKAPPKKPAPKKAPPQEPAASGGNGADPNLFANELVGIGQYKEKTWREMSEGAPGGGRHGWLVWLCEKTQGGESERDRMLHDRCLKVLSIIENKDPGDPDDSPDPGDQ